MYPQCLCKDEWYRKWIHKYSLFFWLLASRCTTLPPHSSRVLSSILRLCYCLSGFSHVLSSDYVGFLRVLRSPSTFQKHAGRWVRYSKIDPRCKCVPLYMAPCNRLVSYPECITTSHPVLLGYTLDFCFFFTTLYIFVVVVVPSLNLFCTVNILFIFT